ncbi:rhodanese-like domain-containing protein [Luteolibacter luteus]|uniref:Rhodanese-like domain-containing protein n=1 Tax=Luteolibacter luteus TaxID=2728835 RepID=A0A858RK08_9BACT|nr:rhodanese-like domain-containing protein [Luteolibacter luteus]QJE96911.1 rhodanese-like domain-containing protein [Luteolibacter luteus]
MKAALTLLLSCFLTGFAAAEDGKPKDGPVKVEQAEQQISSGIQLLDVRSKDEWDEGHLKGAKLLPVSEEDFAGKAKAFLDPKKPVLVYCRSGKRSEKAAKELRDAGFTPVYEMEGGILAWEKAGKPVEK